MSRSIWRCSGAHWIRCAGAWAGLGTALLGLVSTSSAETTPVAARAEKSGFPTHGQRIADATSAGRIIVDAIQSFDFNKAASDRYGDVEHDSVRH